jgi:signal peptidase I
MTRVRGAGAAPAVPSRDGWAALCLGTLAQGYLVLVLALTAIAVVPLLLGWNGSVVQTGSMRPLISPGDVVLSTPLSTDRAVPIGAVVEIRSPAANEPSGEDRLRLHRVVGNGESPGEWITAGDANAEVDSTPVTRDQISGWARLLVPWVGLPSVWLTKGNAGPFAAWLLATAGAVALLVWSWPPAAPRPGRGSGPRHAVPAASAGLDRRATLVLLVGLAAGGAVIGTRWPAYAGFSARTATTGNVFRVARWPTLTLGRAASYVIMASTRIANEAFLGIGSSVTGSIAIAPGTTVTGFWPWDVSGSTDRNNTVARNARTDLLALLETIRARPATGTLPATTRGVLRPGTYRGDVVQVRDELVLDAGGDPSAEFVLAARSLTVAAAARVVLRGGASPNRVFLVSSTTITVGEGAALQGVLLAEGSITLAQHTTLTGRALSTSGGVTLVRATVTSP